MKVKFEKNDKRRNGYIDVIRGFAMVLVIWGHSLQYLSGGYGKGFQDRLMLCIYSFHMPLFALLSGYLMISNRKFESKIRSRIINLGYPLIVWGIFPSILSSVVNSNSFSFWDAINSLWFLATALSISIYFLMIEYLTADKWIIELLFLCVGYCLFFFLPHRDFYCYMYPYYFVGYYYRKINISISYKMRKIFLYLALIIFVLLLLGFTPEHLIYGSGIFNSKDPIASIRIDIYRYVIGILGSVVTILLLGRMYRIECFKRMINCLIRVGKYSLEIYVIQHIVLEQIIYKLVLKSCKIAGYNPLTLNYPLFQVSTLAFSILFVGLCVYVLQSMDATCRPMKKLLFGR